MFGSLWMKILMRLCFLETRWKTEIWWDENRWNYTKWDFFEKSKMTITYLETLGISLPIFHTLSFRVSLLSLQVRYHRRIQSSETLFQRRHVAFPQLLLLSDATRPTWQRSNAVSRRSDRGSSFSKEVTRSSNSFWTSSVRDLKVVMWLNIRHTLVKCFYVFLSPQSLAFQKLETVQPKQMQTKLWLWRCKMSSL